MSPAEINRAVANVLGEALSVVQQRGFSLLEPEFEKQGSDFHDPRTIDWDATTDRDRAISIDDIAF